MVGKFSLSFHLQVIGSLGSCPDNTQNALELSLPCIAQGQSCFGLVIAANYLPKMIRNSIEVGLWRSLILVSHYKGRRQGRHRDAAHGERPGVVDPSRRQPCRRASTHRIKRLQLVVQGKAL